MPRRAPSPTYAAYLASIQRVLLLGGDPQLAIELLNLSPDEEYSTLRRASIHNNRLARTLKQQRSAQGQPLDEELARHRRAKEVSGKQG
jgi:hypothetical protein